MADEVKPVVVLKPKPGEHQVTNLKEEVEKAYEGQPRPPQRPSRPSFETDLDGRTARAMKQFEQAHSDMFGPPPAEPPPALPVETTTLDITPEAPPPALPQTEEPVTESETQPSAKPAESPPPAQETTPAAPSVPLDDLKALNEARAAARRAERERRKLERELEELRSGLKQPAPAATPAAPSTASAVPPQSAPEPPPDDDPFGLKAELRSIEQRLDERYAAREEDRRKLEEKEAQDRYMENLNRSEQAFRAEQPDYYDAVQHLADWERQRYQLSGMARRDAGMKLSDPRWRPVIERIADEFVLIPHPQREGTMVTIRRDQLTPEQTLLAREMNDGEAAFCLSTDLWVADRRNEILQSNRPEDIPKVVWEMATKTAGYQGKPRPPASATSNGNASTAKSSATPAERIRQQARVNAASRTTANLSSGSPGEPSGAPQIRSMRELQDFHRRDPVAARRYMDQMSRINPTWHRDLAP